jgi:translation elongation factor EF-1alpha
MAGMASADVAVLVVAADPVEFAAGAAGTLLHAQLAHTADLRQVVVAVTAAVDIPSGVCASACDCTAQVHRVLHATTGST